MIPRYAGAKVARSEFTKIPVLYHPEIDSKEFKKTAVKQEVSNAVTVRIATFEDAVYAQKITDEMEASALLRGCGISQRSPASIIEKMKEGKAVIALTGQKEWVGFSYIEVWDNCEFVSNSGLIVAPAFRKCGVAREIKKMIFDLSRRRFPKAKIFSITTGLAVMKMNSGLGFEAVTFNEIAKDTKFWEGCKSCVNYATLRSKDCKNCFCTAMLFTSGTEISRSKTRIPE